ncbi:UDP-glycosyltransferase 74E2 [Abeliophyllum distichum]|uniref:Glycosyltransferase n=1 Tax=Abeliophyllum distichum TaxID=126358 RepID=A0ABD1UKZ6_9LAMI
MQDFSFPSSISVETISDGYDEGNTPSDENIGAYFMMFRHVGSQTLSNLIEKLKDSDCPVDCIIYDPFLPWGLDVAKRYGLKGGVFFTQSCAVNNIYYHAFKGVLKLPPSDSEIVVPGLPTMEPSDMPSFISDYQYHGYKRMELFLDQFKNVGEADWIFVNSFYKLEEKVIDYMTKLWPVKTIGPTIPSMYLDKRLHDDKEYGLSVFKPITDSCMKWLNEKPTHSVIYVSFGSIAQVGLEQMEELAMGLKMSNKNFLLVVRKSEEDKLPKNFAKETSKNGLIVSWSSQLEILAHEAVGCFISHCGWNSTLEALCLGVPMVAMPHWTDQTTNAKFIADVWQMGIKARPDVKGIVSREEIDKCINLVMDGDNGKEIRKNGTKWKEFAREAIDEGGSSDKNIEEFVYTLASLATKLDVA